MVTAAWCPSGAVLCHECPLPQISAHSDITLDVARTLTTNKPTYLHAGLAAWENYPTLKCLMEMVMTNTFRFPPPTMAADDKAAEEVVNRDKQVWAGRK